MSQGQEDMSTAGGSGAVLDPTMSLVGRLEDLSLGEILQIVSLSRRSGLLRIESPSDRASIYIRAGRVVYSSRSDEKEGLLSHLLHHGLVEKEGIESLRGELESLESAEQLRDLLQDRLGISPDAFRKVLKNRVEELVYSLFYWEEGTFSFQLIDEEKHRSLLAKISPFFLEQGIECQFLVMEGARRKDEMAHQARPEEAKAAEEPSAGLSGEGSSAPASGRPAPEGTEHLGEVLAGDRELEDFRVPETLPPLDPAPPDIVVIIGLGRAETDFLADILREKGLAPLLHEGGAEGLTMIQELRGRRSTPLVILDIEAPGITDGRSLGGLEVLSTIWDLGLSLPVLLVHRGELPGELAEKLESVPGLRLLHLRHSGNGYEEAVRGVLAAALDGVLPGEAATGEDASLQAGEERVPGAPPAEPSAPEQEDEGVRESSGEEPVRYYDIQGELVGELEGIDLPFENWEEGQETPPDTPLDPHMAQLTSYVQELNRQEKSGEVTLLALRFASVFMSRGVLLLVRKEDIKGLGQFGVDLGQGRDADALVRSLTLPLGGSGVFQRVVARQQSYKGPPSGSETEQMLFDALGGGVPDEIYLGPIVSMGKVAVLLYGDDLSGDKAIEPIHTLDIFLSHVGLALDRAFLEMKLKTRRS